MQITRHNPHRFWELAVHFSLKIMVQCETYLFKKHSHSNLLEGLH